MNSSQLFEICKEAQDAGLVVRYDVISYRNCDIYFLSDIEGRQRFAQWEGELVDLGLNNIHYKEDMCRFIDRKLDLITTFPDSLNFTGAKLEWFQNGDYRDIRLCYRGRVLKIFLVVDTATLNIINIINEAKVILNTKCLLEE